MASKQDQWQILKRCLILQVDAAYTGLTNIPLTFILTGTQNVIYFRNKLFEDVVS